MLHTAVCRVLYAEVSQPAATLRLKSGKNSLRMTGSKSQWHWFICLKWATATVPRCGQTKEAHTHSHSQCWVLEVCHIQCDVGAHCSQMSSL